MQYIAGGIYERKEKAETLGKGKVLPDSVFDLFAVVEPRGANHVSGVSQPGGSP